jgi:hypothetical protein
MDPKTLSDWAQWLAMGVISLVVWLRKPGEDAQHSVDTLRADVDERINGHMKRLVEVETHMRHMPTSEELAKLEGTVKQIDERSAALAEAIGQLRIQLNRIESFLLGSK